MSKRRRGRQARCGIPRVAPAAALRVYRRRHLPGGVAGFYHHGRGIISIATTQSRHEQHVTLLHEILHFIDETTNHEVLRIPHRRLDRLATNLLDILVDFGLYRGLSRAELDRSRHRQLLRPWTHRRRQ